MCVSACSGCTRRWHAPSIPFARAYLLPPKRTEHQKRKRGEPSAPDTRSSVQPMAATRKTVRGAATPVRSLGTRKQRARREGTPARSLNRVACRETPSLATLDGLRPGNATDPPSTILLSANPIPIASLDLDFGGLRTIGGFDFRWFRGPSSVAKLFVSCPVSGDSSLCFLVSPVLGCLSCGRYFLVFLVFLLVDAARLGPGYGIVERRIFRGSDSVFIVAESVGWQSWVELRETVF